MSRTISAAAPVYGASETRSSGGSPAIIPDPDDRPPTPASPAKPVVSVIYEPTGYEEALERLAAFNANILPDMNEQVQADPTQRLSFERAVLAVCDWPALARRLTESPPRRDPARLLLKQLGFVVASVNRHALVEGATVGRDAAGDLAAFFRGAAGVEIGDILADLGARGQHPHYPSAATYRLMNPEGLMHTRSPGERYFHRMVNETAIRFGRAAEYVKSLQTGDIAFDLERAGVLLAAALEEIVPLHQGYNFVRDKETGEERMSTKFFMPIMRSYLAPALLCGELQEGPNATYTPAWPRLDYALGCRDAFYIEVVRHRYKWMVREHRVLLDQSLALPSLAAQFIEQLGLADIDFTVIGGASLVARLKELTPPARTAVRNYASLAQKLLHISGTHKGAIRTFLEKEMEKLTPEELARIVPSPQGGVGGNPIGETKRIYEMRDLHPVNHALIDLLKRGLI